MRRLAPFLLAAALLALALAACSDETATGVPPPAGGGGSGSGLPCLADTDCGAEELCLDALCAPRDGVSCVEDSHCAIDQHCAAGSCAAGGACELNDDCPVGLSCQSGGCLADARPPCDADGDCDAGQSCVDRFCEDGGGGGASGDCLQYAPVVAEDPADRQTLRGVLSFGSSPNIGDVRVATVTVTNSCDREVRVLQAGFESTTSAEFSVEPRLAQALPLLRGEQLTLTITYAPVDFEEDRTGQFLAVTSTDTHPTAKFELQVEYKGSSIFSLTEGPADSTPSVAAWNFGAVAVGQSGTKLLFLKNAGSGNHLLHLSSLNIDAAGTAFSVTPVVTAADEPIVLPPFRGCAGDPDCAAGQSCDTALGGVCKEEDGTLVGVVPVEVTFTPTQARPERQQLVLEHDEGRAGEVPQPIAFRVELTGGGGNPPVLSISPEAIDFGEVEVGTFVERTIQLQNGGDQELQVGNLRLAALSSPEFSFSPASLGAIPSGSFQNLTIRYAPVGPAIGNDIGAVELTSNDPARPTAMIQLGGVSTNPTAFVNPSSLAFGGVWLGDPAGSLTVTIRNAGFGLLRVTGAAITAGSDPGFSLAGAPALPYDLPDATVELQLEVRFLPGSIGDKTGALLLETTDSDSPTITIPLTGTGLDCSCAPLGATWSCDHGSCVMGACLPGFLDLNRNPADGCELLCTPTGNADFPDPGNVDDNCDGIDGDAGRAWFVATDGSDTNAGTRDFPFRTIGQGIAVATPGVRDHVYVSEGVYTGQVTLRDGVSVWGGFSRGAFWDRDLAYQTTITNSTVAGGRLVAVSGSNLTATTVVGDLNIQTTDTAVPEASNYAVYCSGCAGLVLERNQISAGSGGPGIAGSAGAAGDPGSPGQVGGGGSCDGSPGGAGGPGGTSSCGRTGGVGGNGGGEGSNSGATGGSGAGGTAGGTGGGGGDPGRTGSVGGTGSAGGAGGNGSGGNANGSVVAGVWVGSAGATGLVGTNGNGGGGGGGGGGQGGTWVNDGSGNGGGGGGAGGCGGLPGAFGTAGGGSFGVFLVSSTGVRITGSAISSANGGRGGNGGAGGNGGNGGAAGPGGTACTNEVGAGGSGGSGGSGGRGGHAGGGGGGITYAVYRSNTTVDTAGNNLSHGVGGGGGSSSGNGGSTGAAGDVN